MKKLLKFDIIHPPEYLQKKVKEWTDLDQLSLQQYRERLIALRSNYSDYYTHHLNTTGLWEAEEFFLLDPVFIEKAAVEVFGPGKFLLKLKAAFKARVLQHHAYYTEKVIHGYIEKFNPDVLFVRSQPLPSEFWQQYRDRMLLVARLSARLPRRWHPNDWDLIYTDQPTIREFFDLQGTPTILNDQGFDQRVVTELAPIQKRYDCTFIGGLGTQNFLQRTEFINEIANKIDFKWWGYWWSYGSDGRTIKDFPKIEETHQGSISGLAMYQLYADSKICLNDYVDTANGIGFNQRMFEVMGVGGFLLTRNAPNFAKMFPKNIFITYNTTEDCIDKINYYLKADKERNEIAKAAQRIHCGKIRLFENYPGIWRGSESVL